MQERLKVLKASNIFTTCNCCGFQYLPMNKMTAKNCPKCKPNGIDEDELYLENEMLVQENVNNNSLYDDFPKRSEFYGIA